MPSMIVVDRVGPLTPPINHDHDKRGKLIRSMTIAGSLPGGPAAGLGVNGHVSIRKVPWILNSTT